MLAELDIVGNLQDVLKQALQDTEVEESDFGTADELAGTNAPDVPEHPAGNKQP